MQKPMLSILIPTYNRKDELSRAIDSILGQNIDGQFDEKIEVIIQNNASTDNTYDYLESIKNKSKMLKIFHNPSNIQLYGNIVEPLKNATGKYVLYLTDDDYMLPHSLHKILSFLEKHSYDFIRLNLIVYFQNSIKSFTHLSFRDLIDNHNTTTKTTASILASTHILSGNIFKREKISLEEMIEIVKDDNKKWFAHVVIPITMLDNFCFYPEALILHTWENQVYWENNTPNISYNQYSVIDNCFLYILSNSKIDQNLKDELFYQLDPNTKLYPYTKSFLSFKNQCKLRIKRNLIKIAQFLKRKILS